jgi:hypothetical protein
VIKCDQHPFFEIITQWIPESLDDGNGGDDSQGDVAPYNYFGPKISYPLIGAMPIAYYDLLNELILFSKNDHSNSNL